MGWWSTDIMGGDTPLDFEDAIYDICNVEKFPEGGGIAKIPKESLQENLGEILTMIEKDRYDKNIGYQVLAVMMMNAGAHIPESLNPTLEDACHTDDWAQESDERKQSVDGLLRALQTYDNVNPIIIKSKGLFEVMAEKLGGNE